MRPSEVHNTTLQRLCPRVLPQPLRARRAGGLAHEHIEQRCARVADRNSAAAAVGVDGEREPRWWWCRQARTAV